MCADIAQVSCRAVMVQQLCRQRTFVRPCAFERTPTAVLQLGRTQQYRPAALPHSIVPGVGANDGAGRNAAYLSANRTRFNGLDGSTDAASSLSHRHASQPAPSPRRTIGRLCVIESSANASGLIEVPSTTRRSQRSSPPSESSTRGGGSCGSCGGGRGGDALSNVTRACLVTSWFAAHHPSENTATPSRRSPAPQCIVANPPSNSVNPSTHGFRRWGSS